MMHEKLEVGDCLELIPRNIFKVFWALNKLSYVVLLHRGYFPAVRSFLIM